MSKSSSGQTFSSFQQPSLARGLGVFVASVSVFVALHGCKIGGIGSLDGPDSSSDNTSSKGPAGADGAGVFIDPRVSLINAPCGNLPELESFLLRAKALGLTNKLNKLPAADWKIETSGNLKTICQFMADSGLEVALFRVFPVECSTCSERFLTDSSGWLEFLKQSRIVAILSGVEGLQPLTLPAGNAPASAILVRDPGAVLLKQLRAKSDSTISPQFIVHRSGYGAFANTEGPAMDSMLADFKSLARIAIPSVSH